MQPTMPDQRFSPAIQRLIDLELAAGNAVECVGPPWGDLHFLVMLRGEFRTSAADHPSLRYSEVNDPHYWKAQFVDEAARQAVACRFAWPPAQP
jgi:hypothetical protein